MSCPSSCAPRRVAGRRWRTRSAGWRSARAGRSMRSRVDREMEIDLEAAVLGRPVLRRGGRREWLRVARRELEAHRARQAQPIPRDRDDRLFEALGPVGGEPSGRACRQRGL